MFLIFAARQLTTEGYLSEQPIPKGFGCTICLSGKAADWLRKARNTSSPSLKLLPNNDLKELSRESVRVEVGILPTKR